jgi:hypothetical protein
MGNFGFGEGLTHSSSGITIKAILGYEFDRPRSTPDDSSTRPR